MSSVHKKKSRSLKNLLIEPFKQVKFGVYVLAITTIYMIASGYFFIHSFIEQYAHVMSLFQVVDANARWDFIVNDVFYNNAGVLGILYVGFALILFTLVIKLTHRYYGPLVSIERFIQELIKGNYGHRITVRKSDELQGLVKSLNTLAEALQKNKS